MRRSATRVLRSRNAAQVASARNVDDCQASCVDWYGNARPIFIGERLFALLCRIQRDSRSIGDVRGRGLMLGVEIVDRDEPGDLPSCHPSAPALAGKIQHEALRRGLILELGGRHNSVVRFLPPLIVTEEQIDTIAAIFADAVKAAEQQSEA